MRVRQLSVRYLPQQDRILIRINTTQDQELQFWLTRRLTLGLMPLFDRIAAAPGTAPASGGASAPAADPIAGKAIADFVRDASLRGTDFSTPYQTSPTSKPLFDGPLLITEINLTPLANRQLRLGCSERLDGASAQRRFDLTLTEPLTHALTHLLAGAVRQSQWIAQPGADAPGGPPSAALPQYLN